MTADPLDSARDFVPRATGISFTIPARTEDLLKITIDPDNNLEVIYDENNTVELIVK